MPGLFIRRILEAFLGVCRRVLFAVQHEILPFHMSPTPASTVCSISILRVRGSTVQTDLTSTPPSQTLMYSPLSQDGLAILGVDDDELGRQFGQTGPLHSSSSTK